MVLGLKVYEVLLRMEHHRYFSNPDLLLLRYRSIRWLLQWTCILGWCRWWLKWKLISAQALDTHTVMDQDDLLHKNLWGIWTFDLDVYLLHQRSGSVHYVLLLDAFVVHLLFLYFRWRSLLIGAWCTLQLWISCLEINIFRITLSIPIPDIVRVPVRSLLQQKYLWLRTNQLLWKVRNKNSFQQTNRCFLPMGVMVLAYLLLEHFDDQLHCCCDYQFLRTSKEQAKNHFL